MRINNVSLNRFKMAALLQHFVAVEIMFDVQMIDDFFMIDMTLQKKALCFLVSCSSLIPGLGITLKLSITNQKVCDRQCLEEQLQTRAISMFLMFIYPS